MSKLNKLEMLDTLFEKLAAMPTVMQQAQQPAGAKPCVHYTLELFFLSSMVVTEIYS